MWITGVLLLQLKNYIAIVSGGYIGNISEYVIYYDRYHKMTYVMIYVIPIYYCILS